MFVRQFCHGALPDLLTGAGLSDDDARGVAVDVIRRARMLAALPANDFDVLVTPFIEEVSQHRPLSAPAWLRASVVVAVRNSRLEDFHALGGPCARPTSRPSPRPPPNRSPCCWKNPAHRSATTRWPDSTRGIPGPGRALPPCPT
ncbi:hypothetical protein ACFQ0G_00130 [Streptomyces chiangmaiensis]